MPKMNGDLMYKRIEKYAERKFPGITCIDWKYESLGKDVEKYGCLCKVVKLNRTYENDYSGSTFDISDEIFVPYDGRKPVISC